MKEKHSLTLSIPMDTHEKLGVLSALSHKSKTQIIIELIDKQKINIPEHMLTPGKASTPKHMKASKPETVKTVKRKDQNPNADEGLIKVEILKHQQAGLSLQKIADALNAAEFPTLRGGAEWAKGTVDGLLRKWGEK
jgi:hypothetical protein